MLKLSENIVLLILIDNMTARPTLASWRRTRRRSIMDPVRTCSTVGEREEQAARFDFTNEPNILMTPEVNPTVAKARTQEKKALLTLARTKLCRYHC